MKEGFKRKFEYISPQELQKKEEIASSVLASGFTSNKRPKIDFLSAVIKGNLSAVTEHLNFDANAINLKSAEGEDAFHLAIKHNHWYVASHLLSIKKDFISTVDIYGNNAFLAACDSGNIQNVERLLKIDPTLINSVDNQGVNGFHVACENEYIKLMNLFLEKDRSFLTSTDNHGENAFLKASEEGKIEALKELLKLDPTLIESLDKNGNNCLKTASDGKHMNAVNFLLSKKPELVLEPGNYSNQTTTHEILKVIRSEFNKQSNKAKQIHSVNPASSSASSSSSLLDLKPKNIFQQGSNESSTLLNADPKNISLSNFLNYNTTASSNIFTANQTSSSSSAMPQDPACISSTYSNRVGYFSGYNGISFAQNMDHTNSQAKLESSSSDISI